MRRWRHRGTLIGLILISGPGAAPPPAREVDAEGGFVSLFDGESLAGWRQFGGKAEAWGVEGGHLISLGHGGGWLGTSRPYADFVLRFSFLLSPESNSGIYLRAPADTSHISRTGMEIQLLDEAHPRYKDIQPWQRTGAIYHVAAPEPGHLKPTGQWNTMEITARGPDVEIKLNGATIVHDRLDKHPPESRRRAHRPEAHRRPDRSAKPQWPGRVPRHPRQGPAPGGEGMKRGRGPSSSQVSPASARASAEKSWNRLRRESRPQSSFSMASRGGRPVTPKWRVKSSYASATPSSTIGVSATASGPWPRRRRGPGSGRAARRRCPG